jgi:hypothetical protein
MKRVEGSNTRGLNSWYFLPLQIKRRQHTKVLRTLGKKGERVLGERKRDFIDQAEVFRSCPQRIKPSEPCVLCPNGVTGGRGAAAPVV